MATEAGRPAYSTGDLPLLERGWDDVVWPRLGGVDFECVLELGSGDERSSERLLRIAKRLIVVEANNEPFSACEARLDADPRVHLVRNDGFSLAAVGNATVSLIVSCDAMVSLHTAVVQSYVHEFARVLRADGHGLCHHSNYVGKPEGGAENAPGGRGFMSKELFAHYCRCAGLCVIDQLVIDAHEPELDCVTLFRKSR